MKRSNLRRELTRNVRNRNFERMEVGILFPKAGLQFCNYFEISVNGDSPSISPNLVVDEGLAYVVGAALVGVTQIGTWYVAPYAGNVSPQASWTAANFTSNSTEFTNYDEATRVEWSASQSANSVDNTSSRAEFTIGSGAQDTIWGAGLLSVSTKSGTSGTLFAASKLDAARDGLTEGSVITIGYTSTLTNAP